MPNHPEISQSLRKNLVNKYLSLEGNPTVDTERVEGWYGRLLNNFSDNGHDIPFEFIPDHDYIARRGGISKISKLITLHEGKREETKNRAFECPFVLNGNLELIRIAYESGLGNSNAMRFGMIETVDS